MKQALRESKPRKARDEADASARSTFIEESGLLFEDAGHTRMAGRIFGLLLISDRPMLSSADITRDLRASKASVSTMTRALLQQGVIERIARPGDRKDYFRVKSDSLDTMLDRQMAIVPAFLRLLERSRFLSPTSNRTGKECIERMIEFYQWLATEMPAMMERWNRRKRGVKSP